MISIIMPVYNEEKYITDSINSILSQSYSDFEILVVNDGSTDNTLEILNKLSSKDKRIRVFNPGKLGKVGACNYAVTNATGEWFTEFAGDDIVEPGILEAWIKAAKKYDKKSGKVVFTSRIRMFSEEEKYKRYSGIEIPKNKKKTVRSGAAYMASRSVMLDMFPIPEKYPNEDGWMALYIEFLIEENIPVTIVALNYRIHSNNSLNKNAKFDEFNEKYHKRLIVSKCFHDRYFDILSEKHKNKLLYRYKLENYRYHNKIFKILFTTNCTVVEKLRNIFLSNSYLYNFKLHLNKIFLGN